MSNANTSTENKTENLNKTENSWGTADTQNLQSAFSNAFKNEGFNNYQNQQVNPWDVQAPYLQGGFASAADALRQTQSVAGPNQFVSQFTPEQLALYQRMTGYGGNTGVADATAKTAGILSGGGMSALTAGIDGLRNWTPASMQGILSDANAAANDPSVQGRIDASMRDARRSVSEQVLPQIGRNAALGGNINSSRTGIREGIVERGLTDATADTSANIRGDAYNTGLQTALQRAMQGDGNQLSALQALMSGGNTAAGLGINAGNAAVGQAGGLFDIAQGGIAGQQAGSQAAINDALQRYGFQTSQPFQGLQDYWNIVGGQNYGTSGSTYGGGDSSMYGGDTSGQSQIGRSTQQGTTNTQGTTTTNTQKTPSLFDTLGKIMTAGASFGKMF
jgi:hypothetical protein